MRSFLIVLLTVFIFSCTPKNYSKPILMKSTTSATDTMIEITWDQPASLPGYYWEIEIQTVQCGIPNKIKLYKSSTTSLLITPDAEFPGYKMIAIKCRSVNSTDLKSGWSDKLFVRKDQL